MTHSTKQQNQNPFHLTKVYKQRIRKDFLWRSVEYSGSWYECRRVSSQTDSVPNSWKCTWAEYHETAVLIDTFFCHVFTFFNVFLFSKRCFFKKNVGKVQSGKQINKKHFQNNSNETDLWFFSLHVEWSEMTPYKLLLTYYVWRIVWRPWRPFLWHQAWS